MGLEQRAVQDILVCTVQLGLPVEGSGVIAKKLVGFGPSEYLMEKADCKGEGRR